MSVIHTNTSCVYIRVCICVQGRMFCGSEKGQICCSNFSSSREVTATQPEPPDTLIWSSPSPSERARTRWGPTQRTSQGSQYLISFASADSWILRLYFFHPDYDVAAVITTAGPRRPWGASDADALFNLNRFIFYNLHSSWNLQFTPPQCANSRQDKQIYLHSALHFIFYPPKQHLREDIQK